MTAVYLGGSPPSGTAGYGTIAAQMIVRGTGMGLTSAPATEAIMGVVPKAKAGVGSAFNAATRLLGGTLGVAVIGSVYASLYAGRLTDALPRGLSARVARGAHAAVCAALPVSGWSGTPSPGQPARRSSTACGRRPQRSQLGVLPRLRRGQLRRRG